MIGASGAEFALRATSTGLAMALRGGTLLGPDLGGDLTIIAPVISVDVNTTTSSASLTLPTSGVVSIQAGTASVPYVRVSASHGPLGANPDAPVTLGIIGATATADSLTFESAGSAVDVSGTNLRFTFGTNGQVVAGISAGAVALRVSSAGFALVIADAALVLPTVPGLTLAGTATVLANTTPATQRLVVGGTTYTMPAAPPGDSYVRIEVVAATIGFAGLQFVADKLIFERLGSTVTLDGSDVSVALTVGSLDVFRIEHADLGARFAPAGVTAAIDGAHFTGPDPTYGLTFSVDAASARVNTVTSPVTISVGGRQVTVAAAADSSGYARVELADVEVTVASSTLHVDRLELTKQASTVVASLSGLDVELAAGAARIISITGADAGFVFDSAGVAGATRNGTIEGPQISGVTVEGTVSLEFNTGTADVTVAVGTASVVVPGGTSGDFLRVQVDDATITLFGNTLTADSIAFSVDGSDVALTGAGLGLTLAAGGRRVLSISGADVSATFTATGVSGSIQHGSVLGPDFGGTFSLRGTVSAQFSSSPQRLRVDVAAPSIELLGAAIGATSLSLETVFGTDGGENTVSLTATGLTLSIGDGGATPLLAISVATAGLTVSSSGVLAIVDGATLSTNNIAGVTIAGTFGLRIDTRNPANRSVRVSVTGATVSFASGLYSVGGNFSFEQVQVSASRTVVKAAASAVTATLGTAITVSNGSGVVIASELGLAGSLSASVAFSLPSTLDIVASTFRVDINTTSQPVSESLNVGGDPVQLALPAGPFIQVQALGASVYVGDTVSLTADLYFRKDATRVFFAVRKMAITVDGDQLGSGEGAFLLTATGIAGVASGSVSVAGGGASASATGTLRLNATGSALTASFSIDGQVFALDLPAGTDGLYLDLAISDVSLNFGGFVTIEVGTGSITPGGTSTFTGVRVFLGSGPAFFDDGTANPSARGVLLSNASGSYLDGGSGRALTATGTISLVNIGGVTLSGTAVVAFNDTGSTQFGAVTGTARIDVLDTTLLVAGQGITHANLTFTKQAGQIVLAVDNATLVIGPASLTDIQGALILGGAGVAGTLQVAGSVTGLGLTLSNARFELMVNSGTAPAQVTVDYPDPTADLVVDVPAGPYLRVAIVRSDAAQPVALVVGGQRFEGEFAIESSGGTLRIAATGVVMRFSAGSGADRADVFTLTGGEGYFVSKSGGIGAIVRGTAAASVPGLTFSADIDIRVNTSTTAFTDTFTVGSRTVTIDLPGSPSGYVKAAGTNVFVTVAGQRLSGDFTFEQAAASTTITIANGALALGDGVTTIVALAGIAGSFTIAKPGAAPASVAGEIAVASFAVTPPPGIDFHVSGSAAVKVDTAAGLLGLRVGTAGTPATLVLAGQTISAVVEVSSTTSAAGLRHLLIAVSEGSIEFRDGSGQALLKVSGGTGIVSVRTDGIAAQISASIAAGFGPVTITADRVEIQVNTRSTVVNESLAGQTLNVPAGPFVQLDVVGFEFSAGGQVIGGDARIRKQGTTLEVTAGNVHATLGSPTGPRLVLTNGSGIFTITAAGVSGSASGIVDLLGIPGVTLHATMSIGFDTATGNVAVTGGVVVAVSVGGGANVLPAVQLAGDFTIVKVGTPAPGAIALQITATDLSTFVGSPGVLGLSVTHGALALNVYASSGSPSPSTYALAVSGSVSLSGGGFDLSGTIDLKASTHAVDVTLLGEPVVSGTVDLAVENVTIRGPPIGELQAARVTFSRNAAGEMFASGTGISFSVGSGDASVSVTGAAFALYLKSDGTHAFTVEGAVSATLGPIQIVGTIAVERNTTGFDVDLSAPIVLAVGAGVTRISGDLTLTVGSIATLTGAFTLIESTVGPDGLPGTPDDVDELLIAATGVSLQIGVDQGSGFVGLTVSGGQLIVLVVDDPTPNSRKVALDVRGSVSLTGVAGVTIAGTAGVRASDFASRVTRTVDVGGSTLTLDVAAGVTEFSGSGLTISVAGQTLSGDVVVTIDRGPNATDPVDDTLSVALSHVALSIGDGNRPFASVSNGTGTLVIAPASFTGSFSGNVALDIPGVTFGGSVTVIVTRTVAVQSVVVRIGAPGAPATLVLGGQSVSGVFAVEQLSTAGGETVLKVTATEVALDIAGLVTLTGGTAALVIRPAGVAGTFGGTATLTLPASVSAALSLNVGFTASISINTTPTAVDETFDFATGTDITLDLPAGPFLRVDITGTHANTTATNTALFSLTAGAVNVNASGKLSIERQTLSNATTTTKIGFTDVEFSINAGGANGSFTNGAGAFVVLTTGLAGVLSGSFSGSVGPASVSGDVAVRINTTSFAVDETVIVDGRELPITFTAAEAPLFKISFSDLSLKIGDFVTIEGAVSFGNNRFAGADLEVFLGKGPARLDDGSINPLAIGVLLTGATIGVVRVDPAAAGQPFTYALFATGTLQVLGVPGISLSGTATVRFNNTTGNVDELLTIDGTDTDVVVRVAAGTTEFKAAALSITIAGQTLTGDFTFSQPSAGTIVLAASNVSLQLGGGAVSLTDGVGTLVISPDGVAADLAVDVAVNIPGITFGAGFAVQINTTGAAISTNGLDLPAGPYFRVEATDIDLTIGGQAIHGDFAVERVVKADGTAITRIAATQVSVTIVGGAVALSDGSGNLVVTAAGIAGRISGRVVVAALGLDATLALTINTTGAAVNEQFRVAGVDTSLQLPAGPYLRVDAAGVDVTIGGQTLHGDFSFERSTSTPAAGANAGTQVTIVRVGLANVSLQLGGGALSLTNGSGSLLITPSGVAASFAVTVAVSIPNVTLSGQLLVEINQTSTAVDERFVVAGQPQSLVLDAGPFVRVAGRGISLGLFGQTLTGNFAFTSGSGVVQVAASNVVLDLGAGLVVVSVASAQFVITPAGFAGKVTGASVAVNIPNVAIAVTVDLEINTTGQAVASIPALAAGQYVRVSSSGATPVTISIFGQSLSASFSIEQITLPAGKVVRIAVSNASLSFAGGAVSISAAAGALLVMPAGVAGQIGGLVHIALGGFTFDSAAELQVNTLASEVHETFAVGGGALALDLPAGQFLRVSLTGATLTLSSVAITGDFAFQQQTLAGGTAVTIVGISNASLNVEGQGVVDVTGAFVITATNTAGVLGGHAEVAAGAVGLSADLLVRYNQTGAAVDASIEVGGRAITVRFAEGELTGFAISASNVSLTIGDFVSIEGDVSFSGDSFAGANLEIFLGQGPARLDNGEINPLAVGVLLTNARIGLIRTAGATPGYALHAEGTVMLLGVNGVTIVGTAVVDVNTTGGAVNRTLSIPGSTADPVVVRFDSGARVTRFQALDVELSVLGQTLRGDFAFDRDATSGVITIAATGVSLSLGGGGAAVGVTNGHGAILVTPTGIAADLAAEVGVTIPGVALSGTFGLRINTTTTAVDRLLDVGGQPIPLQLPAGPYLRVEGIGVSIAIAGQTLSGNFAFERATAPNGTQVTTIAATDVSLSITAGGNTIVRLTNGSGLFVADGTGIAGRIGGTIAVTVPGGALSASGSFLVEINTTNRDIAQTIVVAGVAQTLTLARGAKLRVVGTGVTLVVAGQTLTADVAFEQVATDGADNVAGNADDVKAVRIGVSNLTFSLGNGAVTVSNGTGAIFLTSSGAQSVVVAQLGATVSVAIPGVSVIGTLGVRINTGGTQVNEMFLIGTTQVPLQVPAGPFLEVSGTAIQIEIAGQRIAGNVVVRQFTDSSGARSLRIMVSNGSIALGGASPVVSLTNVNGDILVVTGGVAASLAATVTISIPGVSVTGRVAVAINTTLTQQAVGGATLAAGPYLRVELSAADPTGTLTPADTSDDLGARLTIAGQTLVGNFAFERVTRPDGTALVRIGATGVSIALGGVVSVTNGTGALLLTPAGVAGQLSASVALTGIAGVSFSGTFSLAINNTSSAIDETIQVGAGTLRLQLPAGPYLRVEGTGIQLTIAGQRLSGNVAFEQITRPTGTIVRVALSDVSLAIGDGTNDLLTVTGGTGSLLILPGGVAGSFSGDVALHIPGVNLSATVQVSINQISPSTEVHETFTVAGQAVNLDLPAGPYFRLSVTNAVLSFAGLELSGDFSFEQGGTAPDSYLAITISDASLVIAGGLVAVTVASGAVEMRGGAMLARFAGVSVALAVPGVEFSGQFGLELNTSDADANLVADPSGTPVLAAHTLTLTAGPIDLTIAGVVLHIDTLSVVKDLSAAGDLFIHIEGADLVLGPLTIEDAAGDIRVTAAGVAASITVGGSGPAITLDLGAVSIVVTELEIQINTTLVEQVLPGAITLPSGPYVRVVAIGATIDLGVGTISANFGFEQRTLPGGGTMTVIGVTELEVTIDGGTLGVTDGEGVLVIVPASPGVVGSGGIAGYVSGQFFASVPGVNASGGATLLINKSLLEVHETIEIGGQVLSIDFGPTQTNFVDVMITDASAVIADFIYLDDVNVSGQTITGTVFVGEGPGLVDHDDDTNTDKIVNPVARGVLVRNASITFVGASPSAATEVFGSGVVELLGIPGVTISGGVEFDINHSAAGTKRIVIGTAADKAVLEVAGQRLEGQFVVTIDAQGVLTVTMQDVLLSLANGIVEVSIVTAEIKMTPAGVIAAIDGTIAIDLGLPVSDFSFDIDSVQIRINTTLSTATTTTNVVVDPGVSVRLNGAELTIFGQTIHGNFGFEQVTIPPAPGSVAAPQKIVRMALSDVDISIGGVVNLTNGEGLFVLLPATGAATAGGFAGRFSGHIEVQIPGLSASEFTLLGDLEFVVNNSTQPVFQQFELNGQTITLDVPAGPFLRAVGNGVTLRIFGQRLSGNFGFEQVTPVGSPTPIVRIVATNVTLGLGDGTTDFVRLTNGTAFLVIYPVGQPSNTSTGGIAARIVGTIELNLPIPLGLNGTFGVDINTTGVAVSETFTFADGVAVLELSAGNFIRVTAADVDLTISSVSLHIDRFSFQQETSATGERSLTIVLSDTDADTVAATLSLSDAVRIDILDSVLLVTPNGLAGSLGASIVFDIPGVTLTGSARLLINNGSSPVSRPDLALDLPAGPYLRVEVTGSLALNGLSLGGTFVLERSTTSSGATLVKIGMSGVHLDLGGVVSVTNGQGVVLILPADFGLTVTGATGNQLTVTGHGLTTGAQIRYVKYGDGPAISGLDSGSTYFVTVIDANTIRLSATSAGTPIGGLAITPDTGTQQTTHTLQAVTGPRIGTAIANTGGVAGSLAADVGLDVPGVTFSGSFAVKINTSGGAVNDTLTVGGVTLVIDVPAGPYVRVEGTGIALTVAGITLSGNFAFERAGTTTVIVASDVSLDLGGDLLRIFDGEGVFVIVPATTPGTGGIAGRLSVSITADFGGAVQLGGTVELRINQTGGLVPEQTFQLGDTTVTLPELPGPRYLRVQVTGVNGGPAYLEIAGQRLTAELFSFEQQVLNGVDGLAGTPDDVKILKVSASGVELRLGGDLVVVSSGSLDIEISPAGLAGVVSATVSVNIPNVLSLGGSVTVKINQRAVEAVVGSTTLPAGPFLQVEANDVDVNFIDGLLVIDDADLLFEQSTTASGQRVVKVGITFATVSLAGILALNDGEGLILIKSRVPATATTPEIPSSFAASIRVTPVLPSGFGISFTGTFKLLINSGTTAVNEQFVIGGRVLDLIVPAGPGFLRVDATDVSLTIAGQTLTGDFSFEKSTIPCSPTPCTATSVIKIAANHVGLRLGDGTTDYVVVSEGSGALVLQGTGLLAQIQATVAINIPGISVGGTFSLKINTTAADFTGTVQVGSSTLVLDLPRGLAVAGTGVYLDAFGQRISGNFTFEKTNCPATGPPPPGPPCRPMIKLGMSNVEINLGDGSQTFLRVYATSAVFVIGAFQGPVTAANPTGVVRGMAGEFVAGIETGPALANQFSFSGAFRVQFNNTGVTINESITVAGSPITINIAGSTRFSVEGGTGVNGQRVTLTVAGQTISVGSIFFSQTTSRTGTRIVSVGIQDLRIVIRSGTPVDPDSATDPSVVLWLGGINGAMVLTPTGLAAQVSVTGLAPLTIGGVTVSFSSLSLLVNTGTLAVNQTFGSQNQFTVNVGAGRLFRIELLGATVTFGTASDAISLTGNLSVEQATTTCPTLAPGSPPPATPCTPQTITKLGLAGFAIVKGLGTPDEERYLDVSGALVILPDLDGGATPGTKGIAGVLTAFVQLNTGAVDFSGSIGVEINTTGLAVDQYVTVGSQQIHVQVGAEPFTIVANDVKITIGDFITIEGSVSFSGDRFTGSGLLLFVGAGPLYLPDGSQNPDATGLLISNARIDLRRVTLGGVTGYALLADGDLSIIGVPGLNLTVTGLYVRLNTTGQAFVGANKLQLAADAAAGKSLVVWEPTTTDVVLDFGASMVTFAIGGLIQISGAVRFSKQPNGTIDISLSGASIRLDLDAGGDFLHPDINLGGSANFSIGGPSGFKLQSFKVNSFDLFGQNGEVAAPTPPKFLPTADLKSPFAGAVISRGTFNGQGYIDVQFNDLNNVGLNLTTITDTGQEFELLINGQLASTFGIVVNGTPTVVPGLRNVFRYTITGAIPEAGEIAVRFIAGSFADLSPVPASNAVETEYFTLVNPLPSGTLPPAGPVGQLANPVNGSSISLVQINGQRYIDVTFVSRSGSEIDVNTINGDEFTLSGAITADLIMMPGTGGIPDIIGTPLRIGTNTYRYYLRVVRPTTPVGAPAGTPAPTAAPFTTGLVTVTFRAGSFATVDGGLNVERRETFTINPAAAGETASSGTINLGPLSLQGPTVGIADFGFKDGMVVLTIAVGVNLASLQFGSSSNGSTAQSNSGVEVNLLGVLGTFDIAVDVFGLLSGQFNVNLPGKWSLNVQSLEVIVPQVLTVTAEGIAIKWDPANEDPNQEIVRIDEAVIQFQRFALRGSILTFDPTPGPNGTPNDEIPGLRIRRNGFDLGVLELCYGCTAPSTQPSTSATGTTLPPTQTATTTNGQSVIRLGSVIEFDDIRVIVENFSYTVGQTVSFDGSIAIASGGARLFPSNTTFNARISDRQAADDKRSDGRDDTEALRLQLDFEDGRVTGFVFEIDTLKLRISNFIEVSAVGFRLDTGAAADRPLVEFIQVGAKVTIGGLEIGGEARNFAILGDGTFQTKPGFGVFLSIGSASGSSFKWPSWLPIRINAIGIEWPNFNADPGRFLISLSVAIEGLPSIGGVEFTGAIEGVKIDPFLLAEGKFPIVDIRSIAVGVKGKLFGGELTATLLGGIMKFDAAGNVIGDFDSTTPVADRVLFFGIEGGFKIAGMGLQIRLGLSELGPLEVQIVAAVPVLIIPQIGLTLTNFTAGVKFFTTLPDIEDPFDLRRPEFSASTTTTAGDWLTTLKQQVANQFRAIKADPSKSGFAAAFTSPMVITGGADVYSSFVSQFVFSGRIQLKISTDGKILLVGQLRFLDGLLTMSAKVYANLSRIAEGSATILFLADIPDDPRVLTLYGKFQMGFRNASGEEVHFDLVDAVPNTDNIIRPTAGLLDPIGGAADSVLINGTGHLENGRNYVDVEFIPPAGTTLDGDSILDAGPEFTITVNGVAVTVDGTPIAIVSSIDANGNLVLTPLVPNAGETMAEAIARTGTRRFRYLVGPAGYDFPLGEAVVTFAAGSFKTTDVTAANGSVTTGASNEASVLRFTIEGATATLREQGTDINVLNQRGWFEVEYRPTRGATLDIASILDNSGEFTLEGAAAAGISLVSVEQIQPGVFRYHFDGAFTTGVVTVRFGANTWTDSAPAGNRAFTALLEVRGATADLGNPGVGATIGRGQLAGQGYLEVVFRATSGSVLDHTSIDGDEITLKDAAGNVIALGAPQRVGDTTIYRYALTVPLAAGAFTVEYAAGSFTDVDGHANLFERETFAVADATAALADPAALDRIDRELLNNERSWIDVTFTPVGGSWAQPSRATRRSISGSPRSCRSSTPRRSSRSPAPTPRTPASPGRRLP